MEADAHSFLKFKKVEFKQAPIVDDDCVQKIEGADIAHFKQLHGSKKVLVQDKRGIISAIYDFPQT